ncbi:hypothetical protein [Mesorhizobium sp. DCY119]|uniref:hypothetical protein n=1 Tax=Mesorhizobium sp. DCY119 TaxID=2108445 RepID=UPI001FDEA71E|nr:hypothetical protein [Mesorhizobium sp. DCY119]
MLNFVRSSALALAVSSVAIGGAYAQTAALPDYYPAEYKDIVEGSRAEKGVVIYSNMADNNWAPLTRRFQGAVPLDQCRDAGSRFRHSAFALGS